VDSRDGMLPSVIRHGAADPLGPGQMVGEFEVGRLLAAGGMGIVYSAIHPVIGKRAAIKVLHPGLCDNDEAIDRFLTEARSVNRIGHPNIVDVFAFGTLSDGRSYMVMEWLAGESLGQRLAHGGALGLDEALAVLDQTADALEAAHEKGIIHRDLKPDNIFLVPMRSGRTQVKLLDFGIAKLVEAPGDQTLQSTQPGSIMGTPGYLSPEQARGITVDGGSDVYALGCLAFEMLAGRTPFNCDNTADMIVAHLETPPPHIRELVPSVPRAIDELFVRMLDKARERRPSLAEVRAACHLQPKDSKESVPAPAPSAEIAAAVVTDDDSVPARSRRPILFAALAASVTVIVGLIVVFSGAYDSKDDVAVPAVADVHVPAAHPTAPSPEPAPPLPVNGTLVVSVQPAAAISVDGKTLGTEATRHELPIEAGIHEVIVSAPGHAQAVRVVRVNAGSETALSVELPAIVPPAPTPAAQPPIGRPPRKSAPAAKPKPSPNDYMLDPFQKE
jgi:eukaryotic-like serine/threonine-protein kinase